MIAIAMMQRDSTLRAQVVDHLLWAERRPDPRFMERLELDFRFLNETRGL
ncbi:MAG TPA: hypothetical protein VIV60_14775 [Polyangiaceae bacterium]